MTSISFPLVREAEWRPGRGMLLGALLGAFAIGFLALRGMWTLPFDPDAPLFATLNGLRDWVDANRDTAPIFVYVFDPIREAIKWLVDGFYYVLQTMSWIGVTAVAGAMGLVFVLLFGPQRANFEVTP